MSMRMKTSIAAASVCILAAFLLQGCGASQGAAQTGQELKITFTKHGGPAEITSDIHDAEAIKRLYDAALALPGTGNGLFSCPADDTGVFHLTFSGAAYTEAHMDIKASGCRFLTFVDTGVPHLMNDAFVSLFTSTAGLTSLDPSFP